MTTKAEHLRYLDILIRAIEKYTEQAVFDKLYMNLDGIIEGIKPIPMYKYNKNELRAIDDLRSFWIPRQNEG